MSKVRRVYVEKKEDYQIAGGDLKKEINRYLDIKVAYKRKDTCQI